MDNPREPIAHSFKEQPDRYTPINNRPTPVKHPAGVRIAVGTATVHYTPEDSHVNRPPSAISHEPTTEFDAGGLV